MPDKPLELSIDVPAETKRAIERDAIAAGLSVSESRRSSAEIFDRCGAISMKESGTDERSLRQASLEQADSGKECSVGLG